jgi:ABC-2 type transport system permease protein
MFPIENMPKVLQYITVIIPARYLTHALRGIMLKGNGLSVLWPDFVAQLAFAAVILTAATLKFQRRLA